MKKLNKLQINPEKVMKNEELVTLRGGYGYCTCRNEAGGINCAGFISSCDSCQEMCSAQCPGTESAICAGW